MTARRTRHGAIVGAERPLAPRPAPRTKIVTRHVRQVRRQGLEPRTRGLRVRSRGAAAPQVRAFPARLAAETSCTRIPTGTPADTQDPARVFPEVFPAAVRHEHRTA